MRQFIVFGLVLAAPLVGCESEEPCQDYVDYICACHDGEEGFDCAEVEETFGNADADLQDECSITLDEQRQQDEADGLECEL